MLLTQARNIELEQTCPVKDCRAIYSAEYSHEINDLPKNEQAEVLADIRKKMTQTLKDDHQKGKHHVK